jgi:hypothetical protein
LNPSIISGTYRDIKNACPKLEKNARKDPNPISLLLFKKKRINSISNPERETIAKEGGNPSW